MRTIGCNRWRPRNKNSQRWGDAIKPVWQEKEIDQLSSALLPRIGEQLQNRADATLCGQTFEPIWTDFAGGVTRTAEWRSTVNEMGEIPVLEEDGQSFTQTAPILLRLAQRYGRFGGRDEQEKSEILRWLFWDNHKLTGYMATYRFQRVFTPSPNADVLRFLKHRLDDFLTILEKQLSDRSFVIGDRSTVADLSMIGYLQYPNQETGYDFAITYPAISAWLQRVGALPGWRGAYELLPGTRMPSYA